jgi:hypothetical protein
MPEQFWSLTFREFNLKWDGFLRAEQRAEWLVGRHAMLTTRFEKKPASVSRLLGYVRPMNRYPLKPWLLPKPPNP